MSDPIPADPTKNRMYALITTAIMAVANAAILFVHVTDAQKGAILLAVDAVGAVFAYIFISSHRANVQASATVKAAHLSRPVLPPTSYGGPIDPR